jgi:hypothetical protein
MYTDLGLFTCDPNITQDVIDLFNLLTGRSLKTDHARLLVAPRTMKSGFINLINREAQIATAHAQGRAPAGGRIVAKMNALEDRQIIDALYKASAAGVQIDLFVRGFCCLRPGVPGLSDNIRVASVIGRFLEHSRLFYFGAGQPDPLDGDWYIASADWMSRNLDGRVEAACPVRDRASRATLLRLLQIMSEDRRNAWRLEPDGRYVPLVPRPSAPADSPEALGTFAALMNEARATEETLLKWWHWRPACADHAGPSAQARGQCHQSQTSDTAPKAATHTPGLAAARRLPPCPCSKPPTCTSPSPGDRSSPASPSASSAPRSSASWAATAQAKPPASACASA